MSSRRLYSAISASARQAEPNSELAHLIRDRLGVEEALTTTTAAEQGVVAISEGVQCDGTRELEARVRLAKKRTRGEDMYISALDLLCLAGH